MSEEEKNRYPNLILLCPTHHEIVDKQPDSYTIADLRRWKNDLEAKVREAMLNVLPTIGFAELDVVTRGLLGVMQAGKDDLTVIPPEEKMKRNGLTEVTRSFLAIALAKSSHVADFVDHFTRVDSTFAERLRAGFVDKYQELRKAGHKGDELFEQMLAFASFNQKGLKQQAAGLAVLGYFFEACEVFER